MNNSSGGSCDRFCCKQKIGDSVTVGIKFDLISNYSFLSKRFSTKVFTTNLSKSRVQEGKEIGCLKRQHQDASKLEIPLNPPFGRTFGEAFD